MAENERDLDKPETENEINKNKSDIKNEIVDLDKSDKENEEI